MQIQLTDERSIQDFNYRRFEIDSELLQKKNTFGVFYSQKNRENKLEPLETIYFLHGGDGDDLQFISTSFVDFISEQNKHLIIERRIQFVFPNIGLSYLKTPYDQHLLTEVMPWVEGTQSTKQIRHLYGISMGGTAAFNLFFKNLSRFKSIVCHFPGLIDFNPFDEEACKNFQAHSQLSEEKMAILRWCYQTPFVNFEDFKNNDPFVLFQSINLDQFREKNIYWDCASKDDYGLHIGAQKFDVLMNRFGVVHQCHLREGTHEIGFAHRYVNQALSSLLT
jgi:hypothetical protein